MMPTGFNKALAVVVRRKPFQPYVLEFDSGARLEVHHPEAVALFKSLVVYRSAGGEYSFFDCSTVTRFITDMAAG